MHPDFVSGAIDLHVHSGPDVIERVGTSTDIARAAMRAGMRAIAFKDHVFPSFIKAVLTQQVVPDIKVFGGITLNASVGGLNVNAVKGALAGGCKVVMFPTFDAWLFYNKKPVGLHVRHLHGEAQRLVQTVNENGELVPDAKRVLEVVAEHPDVVLSNGHLGPTEILPWLAYAKQIGIRNIVIEHPNSKRIVPSRPDAGDYWSNEMIEAMIAHGAYLNISFLPYYAAAWGKREPDDVIDFIRTFGPEHCTLITDTGQQKNAMPCDAYRMFCELLYERGVSADDITVMAKVNPAKLLGLPVAV